MMMLIAFRLTQFETFALKNTIHIIVYILWYNSRIEFEFLPLQIEEDDVTNVAYGSDGSFFPGNTVSLCTFLPLPTEYGPRIGVDALIFNSANHQL